MDHRHMTSGRLINMAPRPVHFLFLLNQAGRCSPLIPKLSPSRQR